MMINLTDDDLKARRVSADLQRFRHDMQTNLAKWLTTKAASAPNARTKLYWQAKHDDAKRRLATMGPRP
jgi:hypothetical protein